MKIKFRTENQIQGLLDLLDRLPDNMVGVEVGSAYGESASVFINSGKFSKLYCIDPWEKTMSEREQYFDERHSQDSRIVKIKKRSNEALDDIPSLVDFVYIDANHNYEYVLNDIKNYKKKIKKGGYISGHDYTYSFKDDVIRAVDEELSRPHFVFRDGSWLIKI